MLRRGFRYFLLACSMSLPLLGISGEPGVKTAILVQASPLAGFQYHEGRKVWNDLKVGDALELVREPNNPYDSNAVRVEWRGHMLGYVPRRENTAVAGMLDRGAKMAAKVVRLKKARRPWERVLFEVYLDL